MGDVSGLVVEDIKADGTMESTPKPDPDIDLSGGSLGSTPDAEGEPEIEGEQSAQEAAPPQKRKGGRKPVS